MGNKLSCSSCGCCPRCGCFRAVFKPSHLEDDTGMTPLPKPPEVFAYPDAPDSSENPKLEVLVVKNVDSCIKTNGHEHHTEKYDLLKRELEPRLVVRRGQPFRLDITLSRPYNSEKDGISFIFTVADEEKPSHGQGTLVPVPLLKKRSKDDGWSAVIDQQTDSLLTVQITPAAYCVVAPWKMDIDTKLQEDGAVSYSYPTNIYILYNPWCKQDQVYMKDNAWRDETVLSDTGLIWRGSYNRLRPTVWKYAQFERDVLECSLYLIHKVGRVSGGPRSDPVRTVRAISAAVNSADDYGCIMGNWTDEFDGGTAPTKWIGSMEILQKFYKKRKPVKYGQCWVFSGVLSTICRAVGIPSRPVTNYSSAHDTQISLTVDYFVDEKGKVMEEMNSDSIWNFHVWNEAWMTRPDLGEVYSGWQAIDATPQELSDDMYRCGPASVVAVKRGEVLRPYDGAFLYAEVNADKVFWRYAGPTQPLKLLRKDVHGIGQLISTKAPGTWDREDITATYKFPEKTDEERATMLKALRQSENIFSRYYLNEDFNDIHFHFELRDDIKIGQPFDVAIVMKNRSKEKDYTVNVVIRVDCVLYTGKVPNAVKRDEVQKTVKAGTTDEVRLKVTYEEYVKRLLDQCAFNISCLATIQDTKFEYFAQDDFRVRKPDIKIKLLKPAVQGEALTAEINLENPLPVPLRKGEFTVEGPGIEKTLKLKVGYTVPTGSKANSGFKFTPPEPGRQTIVVKFTSKEMDDVDGFLNFMVAPAKEDSKENETNGNV